MTKKDSVERDEYHKKWAWPISKISQLTSVTGVKIQSISLITNIEIQFMNSVKIIKATLYFIVLHRDAISLSQRHGSMNVL